VHSWGRGMVGGGVVVRWCDGAMAGQMGMAENPAGGHVRSQRQRAAPRNRVIGGSRQCRNRVIGGLGGGSATALGGVDNCEDSCLKADGHVRLVTNWELR